MAIVIGNIGTTPERKGGQDGKKVRYEFRMAEYNGKERPATWYDVVAFIPEDQADMLFSGQRIEVNGRLSVEAYMRKPREGQLATPGASVTLVTSSIAVKPWSEGERSNQGQTRQPAAPAPAPAPTSAPARPAPAPAPAGHGEFDDDIPF